MTCCDKPPAKVSHLHSKPQRLTAQQIRLTKPDANLANYLHNGGTVRLVDFEDSGRSDRAWELAIFTEHLSVHGRGQVPAELALGHFATGAAERARIREYRRLLVTFWLLKLLPVPRTGAIRPARSSTKRLACSNCWAEPSPPSHPNDSSAR